jgi:hypothetical protein
MSDLEVPAVWREDGVCEIVTRSYRRLRAWVSRAVDGGYEATASSPLCREDVDQVGKDV